MRARLLVGAWLVVAWTALWGSASPANVASGVVVAFVLLAVFPLRLTTRQGRFRPLQALRLFGYFVGKLVEANAVVAWEVLTPRNRINEGIVAVPV
ncbi:MAG: Na+/H+ antiporter subunit E, partial [Actinomycetota bacterium]|nr:Na+/H+ antiporter subunit E [Actinomycetota bacterium]